MDLEVPTWVVLPKELWLKEWHGRFRRVAVRLIKALYKHPQAPALWQAHFKRILAKPVEGFPSVLSVPSLGVIVSIYVHDILAAGKPNELAKFWDSLRKHVDLDDVTPVDRFLGRYHVFKPNRTVFHMNDYANQAIELYLSVASPFPLKNVSAPFLAEGSLPLEGYDTKGVLAQSAASVLMKLLWLSRRCRPDLAYAMSALSVQVASWSTNANKQLHRLMCYVAQTRNLGLEAVVLDPLEMCTLDLFCDADLGGCPHTAKSTSGLWLQVTGPNGTRFPIAWASRRQQAVS